jgi:hypothetical protein
MPEEESLQAARAMRRAILGDAYGDAQATGANTTAVEFQDFITSMAWGTWTRTQSEADPKRRPSNTGSSAKEQLSLRLTPDS